MSGRAFLFAPESYWRLPPAEREAYRCGPGRGVLEWMVPNTAWGVDFSPACAVHDFMYSEGRTIADKDEADRVFLNNLIRLIEAAGGNWLIRRLRLRRAQTYYEAVHRFGGPCFWNNKNKPTELGLA